jgi:hypothetical protein
MSQPRLIALADALLFELANGKEVVPPLRHALLRDPQGEAWPSCSLLVGGFKKSRGSYTEKDADADAWLGKTYRKREGAIELPPRELSVWRKVGDVTRIFYDRRGNRAPGVYKHPFEKLQLFALLKGKGKATLYRYKRWYRLELAKGCIVSARGIVWP